MTQKELVTLRENSYMYMHAWVYTKGKNLKWLRFTGGTVLEVTLYVQQDNDRFY